MSESDTGRDFATRVGATPVRRGGRALASFATLLALAALGLAGYPYYQRYVVGVPAAINSGELESLRTAQQRQNDELARLSAQTTALDARLGQQPEPHSADAQGPAAEPLVAPSAMPERALRVAEATFLIQGANDRLLVTGDVRAALAMLLAAQSLIDQIDDAALTDVRAALNADVASLRDVTVVDIDATVCAIAGAAEVAAGFADARRPIRFDAGSRIDRRGTGVDRVIGVAEVPVVVRVPSARRSGATAVGSGRGDVFAREPRPDAADGATRVVAP